jgi:uncharacterized protein YhdP
MMADKKVLNLKRLSRWVFRSTVLLMFGFLIIIFIGQQTINQIDNFRSKIESVLLENIGMDGSLGELSGEWTRALPVVDISELTIIGSDQKSSIEMENVRAELNLLSSIRYWNPVWEKLVIDRLSFTLVEDSSGQWGLKSFKGGEQSSFSDLIEPFIHSRLIQLEKIEIDFEFYSRGTAKIQGASVKVENDDDFHRSEMSVYLFNQSRPSFFLLEGYGDLSKMASFDASGYINIQDFDISAPLVQLARSLQPKLFGELEQLDADVNSEVWFDIKPGANITFKGTMSASDVTARSLADFPDIESISSEITGWYMPQQDWGFRFQDLILEWTEAEIMPFDLIFKQRLGSQWEDFDVSINTLNLSRLNKVLSKTGVLNREALQTLSQLNPSGALTSLNFGNKDSGYYASVYIDDFDISPFKGVPGMRDINGYLEIEESQALFHLMDDDGLELLFPGIYREFLPIKEAEGTVYVQLMEHIQKLLVRSSTIDAKFDAGDAHFLFSVEQDRSDIKIPPEVSLIIGSSNLDLAFSDKYLPYKLSASVLNWLGEANLKGKIQQFGLVQRSGSDASNNRLLTTQLLFDAKGADLDYHSLWPGLRDFDAVVIVDDKLTKGEVSKGRVGQVTIEWADIELGKYPVNHQKSNFIMINGDLTSTVTNSVDLLAESPLSSSVGTLVEWDYSGDVNTKIALEIPLRSSFADRSQAQYKIKSLISSASLNIPNSPLKIEDIDGTLNYSNDKGLYSDSISGRLWSQSFQARIFQDNSVQKIAIDTSVAPSSLRGFIDFPWEDVVSGMIPLDGTLAVGSQKSKTDQNTVTLLLNTDLLENEIFLPPPFGKVKNVRKDLALKFHFDPALTRIEGTMGDLLVTDLRFDDTGFKRGLASFDRTVTMPSDNKLLIAASLADLEINNWAPLLEKFDGPAELKKRSWASVLDLNVNTLSFSDLELKDFKSKTTFNPEGIDIKFSTHLGEGIFLIPRDANAFPQINLTNLKISNELLISQIEEGQLDPRKFLDADLAIDNIEISGRAVGDIAFKLRSNSSGAAFRNIRGEIFSLKPGLKTDTETNFFWGFDGDEHRSRINGPVSVENMSDFLNHLNIGQPIDSTSGEINLNLSWQALPWKLDKDNLVGNVEIDLSQGNFYTSPSGGSAALKLVSLLNFANWLRRLQLDFSDVVGENLAYDDLVGKVEFDKGTASFMQPLQVKMPSGRMSLAGDFNLLDELANAQLVATLPVATNLPWVVAILGNVPAAAGVYLTSKLVSDQVDRLSSIRYQVNGPWDNLEISVDEIFADQLDHKSMDKNSSIDLTTH